MNLIDILIIALGLSMDAFAVAVAGSITIGQVNRRQVFRFSFHFGLFQALMPVLGWLAGMSAVEYIQQWDHWIAFLLLAFIGGKAIVSALREGGHKEGAAGNDDPTQGWSLVLYSLATSIDALAVGIALAMQGEKIWVPAAVIGVVTASLTMVGMVLGSRVGTRFGKRVEILGGLILIGIGVKIMVGDLLRW